MTQIVLTLTSPDGAFVFTREEVPEHILAGGGQALSVNRMLGGRRNIVALGPDEADISFSGVFAYQGTKRSDFLDSLRRKGDACTLTWDNRRFVVIIASYRPDYIKPYRIAYSITFTVVSNETAFVNSVPGRTPMQQLNVDAAALLQTTACSGNSTLQAFASDISGAIASLQGTLQPIANGLIPLSTTTGQAAQCVNQIANEVETATASVAAPIASLLSNTQALITNSETLISSVASFGGVLPGNPIATNVAGMLSQVNNVVQIPALYSIRSVATRMQANLALVNTPTASKSVTVAGGTLYDVAAQQYGDVTRWTDIANANGLNDPYLTGINTLTLPA